MREIIKGTRRTVGDALRCLWLIVGKKLDVMLKRDSTLIVVTREELDSSFLEQLASRIDFFLPGAKWRISNNVSWFESLSARRILLLSQSSMTAGLKLKLRPNIYLIDWRINPMDGWEWCRLAQSASKEKLNDAIAKGRKNVLFLFSELKKKYTSRIVYLFGTGPSLAHAADRNWSDGARIVCNTIVKDEELWRHIDPHLVVAGDAIYHFGFNEHSRQFRKDLLLRLKHSNMLFVYPALFHEVVIREFNSVAEKLVPIPQGADGNVFLDLRESYALPADSNVLNLLLLPLASSIGNNIKLWGFDGRDPSARFFWKNSGGQSYPELMASIRRDHPAFFEYLVPAADPLRYVRDVHGERLAMNIEQAKKEGFTFEMLHPTWTETLQKFYLQEEKITDYSQKILVEEAR